MSQQHQSHHQDLRRSSRRRLALVLVITLTFVVVEVVGAILSNSLALLADAAHMLSDVGAIGLALFAVWYAGRPATPQRTYGHARAEILAALISAMALIVVVGFIFWQAWHRLLDPPQVHSLPMLAVALAGLSVNVLAAWLLSGGRRHSMNVDAAFLHVLGDALSSIGVIVASLIILTTGFYLADPIVSVLIGLVVLWFAWRLLRRAVSVLMEGAPRHIDVSSVRHSMLDVAGVRAVHDLHVWTLTSGFVAMSAHVVTDNGRPPEVLSSLRTRLHDDFAIDHTTLQIESPEQGELLECPTDPRCLPEEEG